MVMLYIPAVETMLDIVGREHARAYVSLLTVVKSMITTLLLYLVIQQCVDQVPPILGRMVFAVVGATLGGATDTFIGPMIYDTCRAKWERSTPAKGSSIPLCLLVLPIWGAWWIVFFTMHIHRPANTKYDYTSMYLLQFVLFVPAIVAKLYFIHLIRKGKMKKWGALELEATEQLVVEEKLWDVATDGPQ